MQTNVPYQYDHADVLKWVTQYDGEKFHAVLCDPPYHLTSIQERFGKPNSKPSRKSVFQRQARGFMGRTWDGGKVAFQPETWAGLLPHMYPGAWLMAFAGSRGWHRMALAIEGRSGVPMTELRQTHDILLAAIDTKDWSLVEEAKRWLEGYLHLTTTIQEAGWIMQPTIMNWTYISGMPKATRIDLAMDKRFGGTPRVIDTKRHSPKFAAKHYHCVEKDNGFNSYDREWFDRYQAETSQGRTWEGHRYGGQILKPACEPIIVAQAPWNGRPIDNLAMYGAGALNITATHVGDIPHQRGANSPNRFVYGGLNRSPGAYDVDEYWPTNVVLTHHLACTAEVCHADCAVLRMAAQSGTLGQGQTAADYFYQAHWMYERFEHSDHFRLIPKASQKEREFGLDPIHVDIMRQEYGTDMHDIKTTLVGDGRPTPIDRPHQRGLKERRNPHPTIKPLSLLHYLATMLLPPDGWIEERRLLVPFAGVGSEMIGGMLAGWEHVHGIELEKDHIPVGLNRLAFWERMGRQSVSKHPKDILAKLAFDSAPVTSASNQEDAWPDNSLFAILNETGKLDDEA